LIANSKTSFRPDIEGLRAVAVGVIVAFHFGVTQISGGFVGVDIFFAISGYLITNHLARELEQNGSIKLIQFYGRRIRRLLPAMLLVTFAILAIGIFIVPPIEQLFSARAATANSVYLSNVWASYAMKSYFNNYGATRPFLHTWSLSVEEQFYLVWPWLLMLAWRIRPSIKSLSLTMVAISVIALTFCIWLTRYEQFYAFYGSPARAWEFGIGGLASLSGFGTWSRSSRLAVPLGWVGVTLLVMSVFLINEQMLFPGYVAVLPVMGTVLVLISGAGGNPNGPVLLLRTAPMQFIGRLSYSIYLWHWPIIGYAELIDPHLSAWGRVLCTVLTLLCSMASYRLVENPVRKNLWLAVKPYRTLALGTALTGVSLLLAGCSALIAKHYMSMPDTKWIYDEVHERPITFGDARNCLTGSLDPKAYRCDFGSLTSSNVLVLFGDSHADEWSTAVAAISKQQGWRLVTYLKGRCPVADVPIYNPFLNRVTKECDVWRKSALAAIVKLHPRAVLIGEYSAAYVKNATPMPVLSNVTVADWKRGMERTLEPLRQAKLPVILLRDTPAPNEDLALCVSRASWYRASFSQCEKKKRDAMSASIAAVQSNLVSEFPNVRYVDLSNHFCWGDSCPAVIDGILVYHDPSHITSRYAMHLTGPLSRQIIQSMEEKDRPPNE